MKGGGLAHYLLLANRAAAQRVVLMLSLEQLAGTDVCGGGEGWRNDELPTM